MDGSRFDAMAKALAARVDRRWTLRGGTALAASALGLAGPRRDAAAAPTIDRYTTVRWYAAAGQPADWAKALAGLRSAVAKAKGFIDYSVVDAGGGTLLTIGVFTGKTAADAAAKVEADWIAKHGAKVLPKPPQIGAGPVILHAGLGVGCPCTTAVENACGSPRLVCCAGAGSPPGGPGLCLDADVGCGPIATPTPTATAAPQCAADAAACPDGCGGSSACAGCCSGWCRSDGTCGAQNACVSGPGGTCTANEDCCVGKCGSGVCYCIDPSRPDIGCPCVTGDASACGGSPARCCPDQPGAPAPGTCISPMADCDAKTGCRADGYACPVGCAAGAACARCCSGACLADGTCGASSACAAPGAACSHNADCCVGSCSTDGRCYCIDPSRPEIGCPCNASDSAACGGRPQLCCAGTCISPMATCTA